MNKNIQVSVLYILIHLGLIFFLYPSNIIGSTDGSHWLPIFLAILLHFLLLGLYMKGLSYFPNQTIISIYSKAGKMYSIFFLVPICLYFFMALIISVRAYAEIILIIFLSNASLQGVTILLVLISTYLAMLGIKSIFRAALLLAMLFLPCIFFVFVMSFQNVDWHYFLPFWSNDFSFLTSEAYFKSFFAVGGGFLFLGLIQPYFPLHKQSILLAALFIAPFFFISVYIPILTFGQQTASTMMFPFVVATDAVNINWLGLDRITMFFLLSSIAFIMLFISFIIFNTAKILNHYLPKINNQFLVLITALITLVVCWMIPSWSEIDQLFTWNTPLRFYVIFLTPLSLLFLGKRSRKKGGAYHA
ncbi:GerAB/ArcD/ProY family transporter [Alkalihalobacillus sp. 1P02AB]|uniref:GerAB/ArcD/ProY family transporter n=1 Tax=Alkalihalobacillus sp. 1P02AB TaxID=3132260 RepID=UPI0039A43D29